MTVLTTDRVLVDIKTLLQFWFPRTVELFDEEQHRLETWRTGAANHRSTDRGQKVQRRWFPHGEKRCTWRTGAANHRSTDRGQENSAAALVFARKQCSGAGFRARWNSSTKNGTDLRLGVRALLIIVRLIVDKKTVQRRWFPRTVELFDKERHRLKTWRTGAANHRSTESGQEKQCSGAGFRAVELFDEERHRLETWRNGAAHHRSTDCGRVDALVLHSRLV
ncbi:hypothetical protein EVAR_84395_1 [Eumeta japonica]|uniref:Uncharacterized protein n=1 Tax=Eumeta variegata TaxID=151549 RepID=A0A4C1YG98_EUMVA|nr:hypothetical protein EVAR_84395_1 [Eumeta japonica]